MEAEQQINLARLIHRQRWAALATLRNGVAYASMVAYVPEADFSAFLLHLSRLAPHTRNLLDYPQASLVITEPDTGAGDPQTLQRVSLQGRVEPVPREAPKYAQARDHYLARLPDAEPRFGFEDFVLFRLVPELAHYVAGFGRTYTFGVERLRSLTALESQPVRGTQ